jgi:nitroimidazol reductase NimA-like FMN-containing flavoprotein (pyridoxamine 5'-phosphate oxidase superfamily)
MRNMTEKEIRDFIEEWTWGTLIGVEGDKPYAVENTYATDGNYLYCGSMPGGRMAKCIRQNSNVAYKICNSDKSYRQWKAVIIEGKAERLTTREDLLFFLRLLAKKMGMPENKFVPLVDYLVAYGDKSNCIRIPMTVCGGRSSS